MATREFKSDQAEIASTGGGDVDVFLVPGGETWLVQRASRRVTALASSPIDVEIHRVVSGSTEDEIVEDLGDSPAVEAEDSNITALQGKVLEAGDKIILTGGSGGTSTVNFHIDYLRIVP
jgi:hypothetical protein